MLSSFAKGAARALGLSSRGSLASSFQQFRQYASAAAAGQGAVTQVTDMPRFLKSIFYRE